MSDSLRTRLRLEDDEIMKALRANPMTARHAEARAKEIINDLITADFRSNAQRAADQLSSKYVMLCDPAEGTVCTLSRGHIGQKSLLVNGMPCCVSHQWQQPMCMQLTWQFPFDQQTLDLQPCMQGCHNSCTAEGPAHSQHRCS